LYANHCEEKFSARLCAHKPVEINSREDSKFHPRLFLSRPPPNVHRMVRPPPPPPFLTLPVTPPTRRLPASRQGLSAGHTTTEAAGHRPPIVSPNSRIPKVQVTAGRTLPPLHVYIEGGGVYRGGGPSLPPFQGHRARWGPASPSTPSTTTPPPPPRGGGGRAPPPPPPPSPHLSLCLRGLIARLALWPLTCFSPAPLCMSCKLRFIPRKGGGAR